MKKKLLSLSFATVFLSSLFLGAVAAHAGFAATTLNPRVKRDYSFKAVGGDVVEDVFVVKNTGANPIKFSIYGVDAENNAQGHFIAKIRSQKQNHLGKWIKVKEKDLILEGNSSKQIPFEVQIPENVAPGTYAGAMVAETLSISGTKNAGSQRVGSGVSSAARIVVKMFVEIPGEKVHKLSVGDFSHEISKKGKHAFVIETENAGNTIIGIQPQVTIAGFPDVESKELKITQKSLFQNQKIKLKLPWEENPYIGVYRAKLSLLYQMYDLQNNSYSNAQTIEKEVTFYIIPWQALLIILALLVLLILAKVIKGMLFKRLVKKCIPYEVQQGDTLINIAEVHNINWKKLAKINKLSAPYTLNVGQKILVPPTK